jgi:hypothetical protein
MEEKQLIPEQQEGGATGAKSSVTAESVALAKSLFRASCERLFDVNHWYEYAGRKGTEFMLTDENGNDLPDQTAHTGQLIRIRLPAPANPEGDGYDWVRIEEVIHSRNPMIDEHTCGFRVRPVENPRKRSGSGEAHFYKSTATSSFLVVRKGKCVCAIEKGRNEQPNLKGSFFTKVRNFFVALGAMLGLAVPMWKLWASSMLKPKG